MNLQLSILLAWGAAALAVDAAPAQELVSAESAEISEVAIIAGTLAKQEERIAAKLEDAEATIETLAQSLAVANGEAELFRRQYEELRLRTEALGLEGVTGDKQKVEQRLLQAVNDLRLERERSTKLEGQIASLSEAVFLYMASAQAADPESRLALEEQLRSGAALVENFELQPANRSPGSLQDGKVLSVKSEWSFLVANIGRLHGVKAGMPFEVVREGRQLGQVLAVDVRERIFGGVLQVAADFRGQIVVGDQMRVVVR